MHESNLKIHREIEDFFKYPTTNNEQRSIKLKDIIIVVKVL